MATQHYIDETDLQVYGYKANANCIPCRIPTDTEVWDIGTHDWIEDQEKVFTKQAHALTSAVSNLLDTKAQEFRYDDMKSARSYAGYVNDFQAEALSLGQWASACWKYMDGVEADVLAQTRTIPTVDELLAELPAYTPPV